MSRTRRNFSAKFKSELVIELLKGEKDLNTIASENNIQPNLLRNWKKEFLDKASVVFDDSREDNLKEKLALERKEKAEYAKKVCRMLPKCSCSAPCCIVSYTAKYRLNLHEKNSNLCQPSQSKPIGFASSPEGGANCGLAFRGC